MTDRRTQMAADLAAKMNAKYGDKTAFAGKNPIANGVIPGPSLSFDYFSGIGGVPRGTITEVFGPPSIGKTSAFGYPVLRNAQKMGLLTGMILTEPDFQNDWVEESGLNPDYNITVFPDSMDEALEIFKEWVYDGSIDYILFDSVAGGGLEADQALDATKRPGNIAGLLSWALPLVVPRMYKNNVGACFVNQVRDDMKARYAGAVEAPGGWAIKHLALMRVQMKPGKNRYTMKIDGEDKMVGREIVFSFKKAKAHNAMGSTARADYYFIDTDGEYPYGFDTAQDVINVAKITKVFESSGAWLKHKSFPDGKLNGKKAVSEFLESRPEILEVIRDEVLTVMRQKKAAEKVELKAVGDE